jgi:hypothetical protein
MQVLIRFAIATEQFAGFHWAINGTIMSLIRYFDRLKICHMMNRVKPT